MGNRPGGKGPLDRRPSRSGVDAGMGDKFKSSKVILLSIEEGIGTKVDLFSLIVRMPDCVKLDTFVEDAKSGGREDPTIFVPESPNTEVRIVLIVALGINDSETGIDGSPMLSTFTFEPLLEQQIRL